MPRQLWGYGVARQDSWLSSPISQGWGNGLIQDNRRPAFPSHERPRPKPPGSNGFYRHSHPSGFQAWNDNPEMEFHEDSPQFLSANVNSPSLRIFLPGPGCPWDQHGEERGMPPPVIFHFLQTRETFRPLGYLRSVQVPKGHGLGRFHYLYALQESPVLAAKLASLFSKEDRQRVT